MIVLPAEVTDRLTILRHEMRPAYGLDSCIAAVRMSLDILYAHGRLDAAPIQAECIVLNPKTTAAMRRGMPLGEATKLHGGHSLGMGLPTLAGPGLHVVVRGDGYLIDPSLDQASRPAKNMRLEPTIFVVDDEAAEKLDTGREPTWWTVHGCAVGYMLRPDLLGFLQSPNWGERDQPLRAAILNKVEVVYKAEVDYRAGREHGS